MLRQVQEMTRDPLPRGIVPMQYAFFGPDGTLDMGAFRAQIEACMRAGVQGIAILGLATEVSKLTREERSTLLAAASAAIGGQLPLCVTVFGQTAEEQIEFERHAARLPAWPPAQERPQTS